MNTSYFDNLQNVVSPLSISGIAPNWYHGPQFKVLAPKLDFYLAYKNGEIDSKGYTEQFYLRVLATIDPRSLFEYLTLMHGHDVTLLCYENPGEFCHRRIVAEWFEFHLPVKVPEISTVN